MRIRTVKRMEEEEEEEGEAEGEAGLPAPRHWLPLAGQRDVAAHGVCCPGAQQYDG